jgi:glycosyltransferase 2 family protein
MRRVIFLIASVVVSAIFLWLALRGIPLADVAQSIRQANPLWIVAALGFITAGLWTRAIRWRGLLGYKVETMQAFHMLNIAMLLNQLPFRAGEVARSLLVTRSGIPLVTAATSILVERLLDTLLVVIWLSIALTQIPDAPAAATQAAVFFGVAAIAAFVVLVVFARYPAIAHRVLAFFENLLPFIKKLNLGRLLDHVLDGIKPLTQWRSALHAIVWTLISWAISLATFYCLALAIGAQGNLALMTVLSITLASFSIAIPVSVAAIGPFEGAVRLAGEAVGMNRLLSTSLGFLFHGVSILGYIIWGTIGLLALGVSLSDVMKGKEGNIEKAAVSGEQAAK